MSIVKECPSSYRKVLERASNNECTPTDHYHCVTDEYSRNIEVCVPSIWVEKGYCPVFNTKANKMDSQFCSKQPCPNAIFRSNEVYKYAGCQPSNTREKMTTFSDEINTTQTSIQQMSSSSGTGSTIGIIIGTLSFLIVIAIVVFIVWKRMTSNTGCSWLTCISMQMDNVHKNENEDEPLTTNQGPPMTEDENNLPASGNSDVWYTTWHHFALSLMHNSCHLYERETLKDIAKTLANQKVILLTGLPGSGKKTLALQVIRYCVNNSITVPCRFKKIKSFKEYGAFNKEKTFTFVYYPDFVYYWHSVDFIKTQIKVLYNVIDLSRQSTSSFCVVLTTDRRIFEYSKEEWKGILTEFKTFSCDILWPTKSNIDIKMIMKVSQVIKDRYSDAESGTLIPYTINELKNGANTSIGILELIALIWKNKYLKSNVNDFMKDPSKVMKDQFLMMANSPQERERSKFALLVYATINNGCFQCQNINQGLLEELEYMFGCKLKHEMKTICSCLLNEYLEVLGNVYFIQHEVVTRCVFSVMSKKDIGFVIHHCYPDILLTCLRPPDSKEQENSRRNKTDQKTSSRNEIDDLAVYLSEKDLPMLVSRFKDLRKNQWDFQIDNHILMECKVFQSIWIDT